MRIYLHKSYLLINILSKNATTLVCMHQLRIIFFITFNIYPIFQFFSFPLFKSCPNIRIMLNIISRRPHICLLLLLHLHITFSLLFFLITFLLFLHSRFFICWGLILIRVSSLVLICLFVFIL